MTPRPSNTDEERLVTGPVLGSPPRFNHVAMSVPADVLDEAGRADLVRFYGEVFGWEELPTMTEDRRRLVLAAYRYDQFVFLIGADEPMTCPRMDHFGMAVDRLDDLQALLQRVKDFAEHDDRVDLVDHAVDDHEVVRIHAFYVGFLLPMMVEVQYFEWAD
jgi:hypothetical protein